MSEAGATSVQGEDPTGDGPPLKTILDPVILRFAVLTYLVVLPVGQLVEVPVNGTMAAGSDFFLALVLLAGIIELGRVSRPYITGKVERVPLLSGHGAFHMSTFFMMAFALWVALGASWSLYPNYALTKGLAFAALGMGALAIVWCGASWEKAADAWLLGTAICLVLTWFGVLVGPDALQARVVYGGGSIGGLPFLRVSGPFPHPNMFGDYLVTTGAILWVRWGALRDRWGWRVVAAAWLLAGTLLVTVSSAWLGAGALLTAIGLLTVRQRGGRLSFQKRRPLPFLLVVVGVMLFTMTLAGLVLPMGVDVAGLSLTASGIRPAIWSSALEVFKEAPIGGIGASPFFAIAVDPLDATSPARLWDAHNIYLSILAQFGLIGAALLGGAVAVLASTLVRAGATSKHAVLLVALLAAGIHGVSVANEEFRHLWALLGLIGLAGVPQWAHGRWWKEEDLKEREGVTALAPYEVAQE